ncbi:HNH endonuclease signature motif containing protein [Arthrobacter sp. TMS1-12-1]
MATDVAEEQSTTVQALGLVHSHLAGIVKQFETDARLASTADLAAALGAAERIFHLVEYLQVVGAAAADQQEIARVGETRRGLDWSGPLAVPEDAHEFKDTAEYLRARLGITRQEAQRRVRLGKYVLPRAAVTGEPCPALLELVGDAFGSGAISSHAAVRISDAVERVRPCASADQLQFMEESLTTQAMESDADLLNVIIRRWEAALDPDGAEPTEELLKAQQGVFLRGRRRGLHRLEIAADDEQFEYLLTVMNTATNPRTNLPLARGGGPAGADARRAGSDGAGDATDTDTDCGGGLCSDVDPSGTAQSDTDPVHATPRETVADGADPFDAERNGADRNGIDRNGIDPDEADHGDAQPSWERRTRPQRQLDGLVGACQVALATDTLPATGGHRPQVMVTIDYRALVEDLRHAGVARRRIGGSGIRPSGIRLSGVWRDDRRAEDGLSAQNGQHGQQAQQAQQAQNGHRAWDGQARDGQCSQDGPSGQDGRQARGEEWGEEWSQLGLLVTDAGAGAFGGPSGASRAHPAGGYSVFGGPVTARTVRKIACDADIIPVVLGDRGEVLDVGRARRLFGVAQRRAMVARDRGCAFPDCTVPAVWAEAHHVTPWVLGGRTDVSNGCLLCSFHHRLIERGNWIIEMKHGIPWFTPPAYIDPDRTPRRNRHRELPQCGAP